MTRSRYTFSHVDETQTSVFADSEIEARQGAMESRYGKTPQTIGRPPITIDQWKGLGLTLIDVTPVLQVTE